MDFVAADSVAPAGSTTTTLTNNVPTGTANGHLMLWYMAGNVITQPATPTGWTVWQAMLSSGTGSALTVFYRFASSEPASYSATVASGKWNGHIVSWSGVSSSTPADAANTTNVATPTAITPSSITTVTAAAYVSAGVGANPTTSGAVPTFTSSSGTIIAQASQTSGAAVNKASAVQMQLQASAGSVTPTLTTTTAVTRNETVTFAFRPDTVAPPFGTPSGFTATPVSATQVNLSWTAVTGASGYDIERDGVWIVTGQAGTTYSDTGLTAGTAYNYRVRAVA